MLPLDRRCRFRARSVGLPSPLEGARGRVGGGSPAALVMELRPFAVTMPRAAPVAVIAGTDFRELAARLLPLRLRFLITSVLSDSGRVTPWSFCREENQNKFSTTPNTSEENTHKEQATGIAQRLALRVTPPQRRSRSLAIRALRLAFSTSRRHPTNRDAPRPARSRSDDRRLTGDRQPALDRNASRGANARAPPPRGANRADASACGGTPNKMRSGRRAEPSPPRMPMDSRRACVVGRTRASRIRARRVTRAIPAPHGARLLEMSLGPAASPLSRATDEATAENIRVDGGVRRAHDLASCSCSSASGGRSRPRRSRVEPSKRLKGERIEHGHPAEVEPVECAKRRVVPTKRGHTAICKVRESTDSLDSFVHGGLRGGSDKVLCASGCAWAGGRRGGQLIER